MENWRDLRQSKKKKKKRCFKLEVRRKREAKRIKITKNTLKNNFLLILVQSQSSAILRSVLL